MSANALAKCCARTDNRNPAMKTFFHLLTIALLTATAAAQAALPREPKPGTWWSPDPKLAPNLFAWTDTCNVYVLRDGDSALLINLGDGSVFDHLGEIGVKQIEWVLFTDHHREQCQGYARLTNWNA